MNALLHWAGEHRAQLVPLLVGFAGIYLLLPRDQKVLRHLGMALALVGGIGVLSFAFVVPLGSLLGALFYLFAGLAIVAAVSTVTQHNPIYSALSFALVTLNVAALFVMRGAQFLAAATVIIYAGAIIVTFLFIIMLSRESGNAVYDRRAREPFLGTLASFALLGVLLLTLDDWNQQRSTQAPARSAVADAASPGAGGTLRSTAGFVPRPRGANPHPYSAVPADETSRMRGLGRTLFSDYLLAVELAGTLLLVAGVGAVAVAPRRVRPRADRVGGARGPAGPDREVS